MRGLKGYHLLITLRDDSVHFLHVLPLGQTPPPPPPPTSLIASRVWAKPHLSCYFRVKMSRGERGDAPPPQPSLRPLTQHPPLGPQGRAVLFGWSGSPLPQSDISNRAVFEVFGWVPPLSVVGRQRAVAAAAAA